MKNNTCERFKFDVEFSHKNGAHQCAQFPTYTISNLQNAFGRLYFPFIDGRKRYRYAALRTAKNPPEGSAEK